MIDFLTKVRKKKTDEDLIKFLRKFVRNARPNLSSISNNTVEIMFYESPLCQNWNRAVYGSRSFGLGEINFALSFNQGNPTVSSWISGWTLGTSWNQNFVEGTSRHGQYTLTTVKGTRNWNLFFEGVGTVYQENVTYKILVPCDGPIIIEEIFE